MYRLTYFKVLVAGVILWTSALSGNLAVKGETVYTMAGDAISDGVVLIDAGKIVSIGPAVAFLFLRDGRLYRQWLSLQDLLMPMRRSGCQAC